MSAYRDDQEPERPLERPTVPPAHPPASPTPVQEREEARARVVAERRAAEARERARRERRAMLVQATRIIWLLTAILEALIGIRVLLKLLAANPQAGFAQFVYGITELFLVPFNALFPTPSAGGAMLELSSLVAMLVYALLVWGLVRTLWIVIDQPIESET